jgi:hypothetical protein
VHRQTQEIKGDISFPATVLPKRPLGFRLIWAKPSWAEGGTGFDLWFFDR